jgi:tRNA (adenine37-N6)-methyltransferase
MPPPLSLPAPRILTLTPIGLVHSPFKERIDAPRQASLARGVRGTIELFSGQRFEHALSDLETFRFIWVLFWFHLNDGWKPKVSPPRSSKRRGVFATRAPHRPNPLGQSAIELIGIDGLILHVQNLDMLDGTPVLDLKPYIPYADCIPDAGSGWLGAADPEEPYEIMLHAQAAEQAALLRARFGVDLEALFGPALRLGPTPHPYRRIRKDGAALRIAVKDFRARFSVTGRQITILEFRSGYRARELERADRPELDAHRALEELRATFGDAAG